METATSKIEKNILRAWNPISNTVLIVMLGFTGWLYYLSVINIPVTVFLVVVSFFIARSIHVADQWEKAVVLRMGKFVGLKGPGIFLIIPILDKIDKFIDQRVRVTEFKADQTLTKDTVPVNVDAVVYWTVWDVEKAALEVQEYETA
ncbi:MAG TPA: SPFH domain-containing protein, partial [Chryseolinea sp.]|nr:SPFH domain-containing protein [Chryseolinea sp.]